VAAEAEVLILPFELATAKSKPSKNFLKSGSIFSGFLTNS
jgi:hypothetical protein